MRAKNAAMLMLAAFIWGTAFVAQSVGMDYIGPFTFNGVRNFIGAAALLPCIWFLGRTGAGTEKQEAKEQKQEQERKALLRDGMAERQPDVMEGQSAGKKKQAAKAGSQEKRDLIRGGICCGLALFTASSLQQIGIQYTSVGKAGFITACYIVLVPVFGIFLHKRVGVRIWIAVALSLTGLYFLCITGKFTIGKGDIYIFACAIVFTLHIMVIDHFSPKVDGVKMSCIQFFVCGLLSVVPMFVLETPHIDDILRSWAPILYAGVLSSGVAYTLQIVGQKNVNPTVASLILSLESCFSVLAGWVVLGQRLSAREASGCALMFAAIILAQLPEKRAQRTHSQSVEKA